MTDTNLDLVGMIFQVSRLMKQKMTLSSGLRQLSILQTQTLKFLSQNKSATMSTLANYLHIELPSATSLVNKLVRQDLVSRVPDSSDRRKINIVLTDTGKDLLRQALMLRKKKLTQFLSYLSEDQRQDLLTILQTVKNHLES